MKAAPVEIREVDAAFSAVLAAIHAEAFSHPWSEESLHRLLVLPAVRCLLACKGETPCGFLLCQAAGGEAEILTLAVLPAMRRRHIAFDLVEALKRRARLWPVDRLLLEVAEDNTAARALYNRCGFVAVARRKGYYCRTNGDRGDAIIMSCPL